MLPVGCISNLSGCLFCLITNIYRNNKLGVNCTAHDCCLILKEKFTVCSIIKLATIAFDEASSYWSAQNAPNLSAFHWSPHGCLITIGQHFLTTRVVHLPKRTETSLITESDQSRANHQLLQLRTAHTAWSDLDQPVRAVHSCKSWF